MGSSYKDKIIMSIGGSLLVPSGGIDVNFLKQLNSFVRSELADHPDRQFFLVAGGGATARHYIDAGRDVLGHELSDEDLDWLGIHSTRLNAHLVRTIFRDIAHPFIIKNFDIIRKASEPVVVAAGWRPGTSTDNEAVLLCEDYGVKEVINLSNIPQVFDKDPKKFKDAKPLDHLTWTEFRKIVGDKWSPGLSAPFDPIAAKKAQGLGIKVAVLNGHDFANVKNYFDKKPFVGTVIE